MDPRIKLKGRIWICIRINVLSWIRICIRIRTKVISWIRIRIDLQKTNQNVWNMSLFEYFFKVLSLYLEARLRIRSRICIKVMRIHNTGRLWTLMSFRWQTQDKWIS
jgi:hypothetical protein